MLEALVLGFTLVSRGCPRCRTYYEALNPHMLPITVFDITDSYLRASGPRQPFSRLSSVSQLLGPGDEHQDFRWVAVLAVHALGAFVSAALAMGAELHRPRSTADGCATAEAAHTRQRASFTAVVVS